MQQTKQKQTEQEKLETSVKEHMKENYSIMTNESYKDTIIRIIGNEEVGYKATIGRFSITENPYKYKEGLIEAIEELDIKIVVSMVMAMIESYEEAQNNKEE